jgi:hypothetical protein
MIDLKDILEIIDEVRLNGNCSLVESILLLSHDGIEFGYRLDGYGYEVVKRYTYRELYCMNFLHDNIYSTCKGLLTTLKRKVLNGGECLTKVKTSFIF